MKLRTCPYKSSAGFTLIELLVAIAIIGILAAITAATAGMISRNSRNVQRNADLRQIQYALEQFHIDQGYYPSSWPTTYIGLPQIGLSIESSSNINACSGNPNITCNLSRIYLKQIPKEIDGPSKHYCYQAYKNKTERDLAQSFSGVNTSTSLCDNTAPGKYCQFYSLMAVVENASLPGNKACQNMINIHNFEINPAD